MDTELEKISKWWQNNQENLNGLEQSKQQGVQNRDYSSDAFYWLIYLTFCLESSIDDEDEICDDVGISFNTNKLYKNFLKVNFSRSAYWDLSLGKPILQNKFEIENIESIPFIPFPNKKIASILKLFMFIRQDYDMLNPAIYSVGDTTCSEYIKMKYSLLTDSLFLSLFRHTTLKNSKKDIPEFKFSVKMDSSVKGILCKYDNVDNETVDLVFRSVQSVCNLEKSKANSDDKLEICLLRQLVPLLIFIAINLPKNEIPDSDDIIGRGKLPKYAKIALSVANKGFGFNINQDDIACGYTQDELNNQFLLNAIDNPQRRSLTKKDHGINRYNEKYREQKITYHIIDISSGGSANEQNSSEQNCVEQSEYGDCQDYNWLCEKYKNADLLFSINVFKSILDWYDKATSESEDFRINKSANIFLFNQLTNYLNLLPKSDFQPCPISAPLMTYTAIKMIHGIKPTSLPFEELKGTLINNLLLFCEHSFLVELYNSIDVYYFDPYNDYLDYLQTLCENQDDIFSDGIDKIIIKTHNSNSI